MADKVDLNVLENGPKCSTINSIYNDVIGPIRDTMKNEIRLKEAEDGFVDPLCKISEKMCKNWCAQHAKP